MTHTQRVLKSVLEYFGNPRYLPLNMCVSLAIYLMLPMFPICNAAPLRFGNIPDEKLLVRVEETETLSSSDWIKPDEEAYKNERLRIYQGMLREKGITDSKALRLLAAQLISENGALLETRFGDWQCNDRRRGRLIGGHCSFGIPQYNTWSHHGISAETFLQQNPEWKDLNFQLTMMVNMVQDKFRRYGNDLFRVILAHNCPACARVGEDNGYYARISKTAESFTSL